MSKPASRRFSVTVTQLPVTRCQICRRTVAHRAGNLTEVLTGHYRRAHPEAVELESRWPVTETPPRPRSYRRRRWPAQDDAPPRASSQIGNVTSVANSPVGPAQRADLFWLEVPSARGC